MKRSIKLMFLCMVVLGVYAVTATEALAIQQPAAGSFAYDIYDIMVNSILKGPLGFVVGIFAILFGAAMAIKSEVMLAISAVLGGAALLKADAIVVSLGMLI